MSALYEPTSWVGRAIEGMTANITGDLFLTYLIFMIVLAIVMLTLFKIPFEWTAISLTGITLTLLAYSGQWLIFFVGLMFLLAVIVARNYVVGD